MLHEEPIEGSDKGPDKKSPEEALSGIMQRSMLRMPFADFEDKLMFAVVQQEQYKRKVSGDARLSCLFFLLGTGFGLTVNHFLSRLQLSLLGLSPEQFLLFFQVGFVFLLLTQLDKLLRLLHRLKN